MTFVRVPAGEFTMGSSDAQVDAALRLCEESGDNCAARRFEAETPQHQITLEEFWIGRSEVTNAQFRAFVEGGGYADQSLWTQAGWQWRTENDVTQPGCGDESQAAQDDHPVVCVSWYEATAYANWLTREAGREFHLPSEAEWEKAACGTDGRTFPWGDEPPDAGRANFGRNVGSTAPVGSFPADASPYGALDVAGNVTEWTASLFAPYPYAADDGRESQAGSRHRALRGGSFISLGYLLRCAARGGILPGDRWEQVGFRLASPGA
jgi:formylglycine-generating enzyme required for sulfatase activity